MDAVKVWEEDGWRVIVRGSECFVEFDKKDCLGGSCWQRTSSLDMDASNKIMARALIGLSRARKVRT